MPVRHRHVLLTVMGMIAASCGGSGGNAGPATTPPSTISPTTTVTNDAVTTTDVDVPPTTDVATSSTQATTTTEPTIDNTTVDDTTTTSAVDQDPDDATLEFLRRGLWSVPESDTRCGFDGAFGEVAGTLTVEYQDPSDEGDFYVACLTSGATPDWPISITVSDPSGAAVSTGSIMSSGINEVVSGFSAEPLIVSSGGDVRFNGLSRTEDRHVTQVHLWLPHDRDAGNWTVTIDGTSLSVEVRSPCATGASSSVDPLIYPLDIDFLRHGGGIVTRHCLIFPRVTGGTVDDARPLIDQITTLRQSPPGDVKVVEECGLGRAGVVDDQFPDADSFPIFPFDFDDPLDVVLTVSTGPCVSTEIETTTTTTTVPEIEEAPVETTPVQTDTVDTTSSADDPPDSTPTDDDPSPTTTEGTDS